MVSIIKVTSIQDTSGNNETTTENIKKSFDGAAKAWANCGGDASLLDSTNISSGTDNGTGDYTYSLTNAFANDDYSQPCSTRVARGNTRIAMMSSSRLTSSVLAVHTENDASTLIDVGHVLSALGDLA